MNRYGLNRYFETTELLVGPTGPASTDGQDGDVAINTSTVTLYGPKAAGAWGSGTVLGTTGPTGPQGVAGATGATGGTGPQGPSVAMVVDQLSSSAAQMMSTGDIVNSGDPITQTSIGAVVITIQNVIAAAASGKTGEVYWSSNGGTTALPRTNVPAGAYLYAGDDWATFAARASWGTVFPFVTLSYIT